MKQCLDSAEGVSHVDNVKQGLQQKKMKVSLIILSFTAVGIGPKMSVKCACVSSCTDWVSVISFCLLVLFLFSRYSQRESNACCQSDCWQM